MHNQRLGTASLAGTGALLDAGKLNIKKYASRTGLAMVFTEYLLYVEHNTRKALELCAEATRAHDFKDWYSNYKYQPRNISLYYTHTLQVLEGSFGEVLLQARFIS